MAGGSEGAGRFEHRPELAPATAALLERLKAGTPGDVLTDADLERLAGVACAPRCPGYHNLRTAQRVCQREYGVVWKRPYGEGRLVCCTPVQVLGLVKDGYTHIRRTNRVQRLRLATIKPQELPESSRPEHSGLAMLTAMVDELTRPSTVKRLEVGSWSKAPDARTMIALMRDGKTG